MTGARRSATLGRLLAVVPVVLLAAAGPASAAQRVVQIGRDGVRPQVLEAEPGDTVRFVNEDPTFAYRARSTGGPWRFDSGPTALLAGDYVVPGAVTLPGTYAYRVAQDAPYSGSVVVAGGGPVPVPVPPAPVSSVPPPPAAVAAPAVPGPLAGAPSQRALGLAVTVGAVLLAGVASLLVRLLLAVPVRSDRAARLRARGTGPLRW